MDFYLRFVISKFKSAFTDLDIYVYQLSYNNMNKKCR